jgi:hypothetical protein
MWTIEQLDAAFDLFKRIRKEPLKKIDVWWCDEGLFVYGLLSDKELESGTITQQQVLLGLRDLKWSYNKDTSGEPAWSIWRSD